MSEADLALNRIEAIVDEIERLQRALGFACPDEIHHEAHNVAARIARTMAANRVAAE